MPTTNAWVQLATYTTTGNPTTITFNSIPQTGYRHLLFTVSVVGANGREFYARFNGDTTAGNYSYYRGIPEGGGAGYQYTLSTGPRIGDVNSTRGVLTMLIPYYNSTQLRKTYLSESMSNGFNPPTLGASRYGMYVTAWNNTASISSVNFGIESSTFSPNATFSLYGLVG